MNYELMILVSPKAEVDPIVSKVEKFLKEVSATSVKVEKLGKKMLSYPIAKQTEGEYVVVNFEAGGEAVGAISKILRLEQEAILRYLIIKTSKAPKVAKVTKKPKEQEVAAKESSKVIVKTKVAEVVTKVPPHFAKASRGEQVSKVSKTSKGTKGTKAKGRKGK